MELYHTFICCKTYFLLMISLWMMYWILHRSLVVTATTNPIRPPPLRATSIKIHNVLGDDVHVLCIGWPQARGLDDRVIQETIFDRFTWNIDYGQDILQERLSCKVRHYERKWNCLRMFAIPYMCMWENPQLAVARASLPSQESCPVCDIRNIEGDITCAWRINSAGIHLLRWDIHTETHIREQKATWAEFPAAFDQLAMVHTFHLSFSNYFENPVTLDCGERGRFHIRAYRNALGAMVWERVVNVEARGDSRWMCDVVVEMSSGTRWRRAGIVLWDSPVGYSYADGAREPPCIDCRWSLQEAGLWVDRSGCDDNEAKWEKRYSFVR